jgi:hypothetical protein
VILLVFFLFYVSDLCTERETYKTDPVSLPCRPRPVPPAVRQYSVIFVTWRCITCVAKRAPFNKNTIEMKHAQENTEALIILVTVLPMACEGTL